MELETKKIKKTSHFPLHTSHGFTLIEMIVVVAVTAMLAMVSVTNYRGAEKRKRVALTADSIVGVLNLAQTYTLSGKKTNNADANCRVPQFYYVGFIYDEFYTLYALNNCGGTDVIEDFDLHSNVRIRSGGLLLNNVPASTNLRVAFYPPFAQAKAGSDVSEYVSFATATITVESTDGTVSKSVTVDGVVGRIQ